MKPLTLDDSNAAFVEAVPGKVVGFRRSIKEDQPGWNASASKRLSHLDGLVTIKADGMY